MHAGLCVSKQTKMREPELHVQALKFFMKLMYLFNSGCGAFHRCAQHLTTVKGISSKEMTGEQMWKKFKNLKNTFNNEHTPVLREILIDPGHTLPTGTVWKNVPDMFEMQLFLREHKAKWTKEVIKKVERGEEVDEYEAPVGRPPVRFRNHSNFFTYY